MPPSSSAVSLFRDCCLMSTLLTQLASRGVYAGTVQDPATKKASGTSAVQLPGTPPWNLQSTPGRAHKDVGP
ncbi:hypothetical protein PVAP13_7KG256755 [Panicum virgatum]|uniref:Uncharacterized protein n=1 Tax=Panicum virgatum TaxID=38727 RepID=A0A8T0QEG3_PANVG|nr:hypothetical protein PVAP13_7KG256755 [Panicum virgatum]